MYNKETLIVVTNIGQFNKFRAPWGVECSPILNNGNHLLPLGWEEVLTDKNIQFEVKEVDIFTEEID